MVDPEQLAGIVAQAIETATAPLVARIAVLERAKAVLPARGDKGDKGERGDAGAPGRDADTSALETYRREIDALRLDSRPIPNLTSAIRQWLFARSGA